MRYRFFATTVTGLEDLAAGEFKEITGLEARPDVGKIFFEAEMEQAVLINMASRMLHRVFLLLAREDVGDLEDIYRIAYKIDYTEVIGREQSFAVRAERHSKHYPFTSMDIAATVGRAIINRFRDETGVRLKVNLDEPDVEFYCLLRDHELLIGLNTTGQSLHRRYYRVFHHRAALNPVIAAGMLRIAGWREDEGLLDPMCGGGTIPIEAALKAWRIPPGLKRGDLALKKLIIVDEEILGRVARRLEASVKRGELRVWGSDASPKSIEGARRNAERAGVLEAVALEVRDALRMWEWLSWEPEHVITNPPYGLRMGISDIERFYQRFLESLGRAAPNAKLTAIVSKPTVFTRTLQKTSYQATSSRQTMHGTLRATIITAQKKYL